MQDTEYLVMKMSRRSRVINNYFVQRAAKQLDTSTLLFLLENHADQVRREYKSAETVFQFMGTTYPLRVWFNTDTRHWDLRVTKEKPGKDNLLAVARDDAGMATAALWVAHWQNSGKGAKRPDASETPKTAIPAKTQTKNHRDVSSPQTALELHELKPKG